MSAALAVQQTIVEPIDLDTASAKRIHDFVADSIKRGNRASEDFRSGLAAICRRKLYTQLGYQSFADYAERGLGVSRAHAYRLVGHAEDAPPAGGAPETENAGRERRKREKEVAKAAEELRAAEPTQLLDRAGAEAKRTREANKLAEFRERRGQCERLGRKIVRIAGPLEPDERAQCYAEVLGAIAGDEGLNGAQLIDVAAARDSLAGE